MLLALIASASATSIVAPQLEAEQIDEVIKSHMNEVRYCYQRRLKHDPELTGKIVVKFVIEADGTVSSAEVKGSTVADPAVGTWIVDRFLRWQFPETRYGGIVIVSYPFLFAPGDPAPPKKTRRERRRERRERRER